MVTKSPVLSGYFNKPWETQDLAYHIALKDSHQNQQTL